MVVLVQEFTTVVSILEEQQLVTRYIFKRALSWVQWLINNPDAFVINTDKKIGLWDKYYHENEFFLLNIYLFFIVIHKLGLYFTFYIPLNSK